MLPAIGLILFIDVVLFAKSLDDIGRGNKSGVKRTFALIAFSLLSFLAVIAFDTEMWR